MPLGAPVVPELLIVGLAARWGRGWMESDDEGGGGLLFRDRGKTDASDDTYCLQHTCEKEKTGCFAELPYRRMTVPYRWLLLSFCGFGLVGAVQISTATSNDMPPHVTSCHVSVKLNKAVDS